MRIGIVPALDAASGGIYQYSLTMLNALAAIQGQGFSHDFCLLYREREKPKETIVPWPVLSLRRAASLRYKLRKKWASLASGAFGPAGRTRLVDPISLPASDPYFPRFRPRVAERLDELSIGLLVFPAPASLSFESGFPYIMAIHDLQHRLQPEFPEVSANGEWEKREYLFRNGVRFSNLVIADSDTGREDILQYYSAYGATADRVKVLPYLPADYISPDVSDEDRRRVREKYQLPERYFFYPAQFWPHKNHLRIVQAVGLLSETRQTRVHVVFSGSYDGEIRQRTFTEMMEMARKLSLSHQIRYLGYASDDDMSALYAEAVGLLMPTFFGPTNIPVLEAWRFGCPVITSDIRGIREQAGDAALLVDPRSVEAIEEAIYRLWDDGSLRRVLAEQGRRRLKLYTPEDYRRRLTAIMREGVERNVG